MLLVLNAPWIKQENDNFHVEKATTPSKKVYALNGSTVTVHDDGWAYSDKNNGYYWDPNANNGKGANIGDSSWERP